MTERQNVVVVGADPFNMAKLEELRQPERYAVHPLVDLEEVKGLVYGRGGMDSLLRLVEERLAAFPERIDGLVTWWDFPFSTITPYLAHALGLPAAPMEAVLKCEHKYWSRLEQQAVLDEDCPRFQLVDPFDERAADKLELPFPFWIKPIKSHSSHLGFKVDGPEAFERAMATTRRRIHRLAQPFNAILRRVTLPPEVAHVDAFHCVAEEIISADVQCTLEGYVQGGEVVVYGVVDSLRYPGSSSFSRYQYPSRLPERVKARMIEDAERVMQRIGYDDAAFNVEFFYDEERDRIRLLEINPRISQSHGDLFLKVDGAPHHQVAIDLALGRRPDLPRGEGRFRVAGKGFVRRFEDGVVRRVPSKADVEALRQQEPGTQVEVLIAEGRRLSELEDQDSYSYNLAQLYLGAESAEELDAKYERCVEVLERHFRVERAPAKAA